MREQIDQGEKVDVAAAFFQDAESGGFAAQLPYEGAEVDLFSRIAGAVVFDDARQVFGAVRFSG